MLLDIKGHLDFFLIKIFDSTFLNYYIFKVLADEYYFSEDIETDDCH